jgi:hypothetical protein
MACASPNTFQAFEDIEAQYHDKKTSNQQKKTLFFKMNEEMGKVIIENKMNIADFELYLQQRPQKSFFTKIVAMPHQEVKGLACLSLTTQEPMPYRLNLITSANEEWFKKM